MDRPLIPEADRAVGSVGIVTKQCFSFASAEDPFIFENRQTLARVEAAYETYGTLNARRDTSSSSCTG